MLETAIEMDMGGRGLVMRLDELDARLSDLYPVLDRAGRAMLSSVAANFALQGRPEKWKPLAPSTVERKGHAVILFETGRLMGSIGYTTGPDLMRVSAHAPYAKVQQRGGRAGRSGALVPARPFLVFQQEDVEGIKSAVGEHVTGRLSGRRFA